MSMWRMGSGIARSAGHPAIRWSSFVVCMRSHERVSVICDNLGMPIVVWLDPNTLWEWGCCQSVITGDWLVPGYSVEGEVSQLYAYQTYQRQDEAAG
jgi:hypothetical protein